mmetsp:Transcript_31995/g.76291  ORF Transcript_31995/g.76291 Transcript_31995/m.76291 type:complete len:507 (-) Transcript_31995:35-1555(-)
MAEVPDLLTIEGLQNLIFQVGVSNRHLAGQDLGEDHGLLIRLLASAVLQEIDQLPSHLRRPLVSVVLSEGSFQERLGQRHEDEASCHDVARCCRARKGGRAACICSHEIATARQAELERHLLHALLLGTKHLQLTGLPREALVQQVGERDAAPRHRHFPVIAHLSSIHTEHHIVRQQHAMGRARRLHRLDPDPRLSLRHAQRLPEHGGLQSLCKNACAAETGEATVPLVVLQKMPDDLRRNNISNVLCTIFVRGVKILKGDADTVALGVHHRTPAVTTVDGCVDLDRQQCHPRLRILYQINPGDHAHCDRQAFTSCRVAHHRDTVLKLRKPWTDVQRLKALPELITGHVQKGQVAIRTHAEHLCNVLLLVTMSLHLDQRRVLNRMCVCHDPQGAIVQAHRPGRRSGRGLRIRAPGLRVVRLHMGDEDLQHGVVYVVQAQSPTPFRHHGRLLHLLDRSRFRIGSAWSRPLPVAAGASPPRRAAPCGDGLLGFCGWHRLNEKEEVLRL